MSETDAREWVTIAEAARRRGLSERYARKLAAKLTDQDRIRTGSGPDQIRLAAFMAVAQEAHKKATTNGSGPDQSRIRAGSVTDIGHDDAPTEAAPSWESVVAGKDAEIAFLRSQLEQRTIAEAELRRMVFAAQQEALEAKHQLAIAAAPTQTQEGAPTVKTPWWAFWRKEKT
jgi:hypothetical protein